MKRIGVLATAVGMSLAGMLAVSLGGSQTVWADEDDGCVDTAIVSSEGQTGKYCVEKGQEGKGAIEILMMVIDIMTVGVGILGVIGISWAGLTYLTAGGSEEKTRIAKRRMYEIVIGLVAYVLIYAVLKWLLPGFGG